ncbi:MAG: cation:proton antiporter [Sumerlaeia bacterium]
MTLPFTQPELIFAILGLLMFLVPMLCARINLPGIVGLILAGVILGPHALNLLDRGELIQTLGRGGLLFIFLIAGLELDIARFLREKNQSLTFGFLTTIIPLVIGLPAAYYIIKLEFAPALLLASMFASHTLLAYPIASRLGLTKNTAVASSVGGSLVSDTGSLLILAVIANSTSAPITAGFWVQLVVSLAILLAIILLVFPRIASWFFRNIASREARDFLLVMALFFSGASLAQAAGIESIIGAFLCGLALNTLIPQQSTLMSRIQFVGNNLLIPIFLIGVGMLVNVPAAISSQLTIVVAVTMCVAVIVAKFAAAWIAGMILKYSKAQRFVMFGMTINQAAGTLAAALVGYDLGLFGDEIINGTVVMILVTCIIGPSITEKYGRQLALAEESAGFSVSDAPQRILLPLANPASAEALMNLALMIRQPLLKEPIYPLSVVTDPKEVEAGVARVEKLLASALIHGATVDVPMFPLTRVDSNAAEGIQRAMLEQRITTLIIGWNGQASLGSKIFGSVLDQLTPQVRQLMIVARCVHPINTANRVVLVIPRLSRHEPTFGDTIRTIKQLANQLSAPLLILTPAVGHQFVERAIKKIKPEVPFAIDAIPHISHLPVWIKDYGKIADDLVVVISAREHQLSWTPALNALPRNLVSSHPQLSFLIVYPPEQQEEGYIFVPRIREETGENQKIDEAAFVVPSRLQLGLGGGAVEDILGGLLEGHLVGEASDLLEIEKALAESAAELRQGVVLLHSHHDRVPRPMFFMATCQQDFFIKQSDLSAHIVFVLVSPKSLPPMKHLRHLSAIAKAIRSEETYKALLEAESSNEAFKLLESLNELAPH